MTKSTPTYQDLERRLAAAEPIVEALKHHEVDAVVGEKKIAFLLLREVTEELLKSEAGFRAMFELPGVGMFQADMPSFRFTRVNQKFCEIIGYSDKELLARTYISLTHSDDRQRDMLGLSAVLRGKTDFWSIEKRCVRKNGSAVWVCVNGAALRDETGRAVRVMAMISDITAHKQAEQERRDAEAELKKRVRERTAELSRTILSLRSEIAKRKLAEQALRDRSEQIRKLAAELTRAEHRERRRIAQVLHDQLQELLTGVKRWMVPLERDDEKTVRQALKYVQKFIRQSIGLRRDKASMEKNKPRRARKTRRRPQSKAREGSQ